MPNANSLRAHSSGLRMAFVGLAALLLSACGINSVPTAEENAKARWADVQNAYDRRAQALPNLAQVAKSASEAEGKILTDVMDARAKATSIQVSDADLTDQSKLDQYAAAQGQLSSSLSRLLVSVEAYPQLQSMVNYQMLQSQVEGSENRINIAIKDYNAAVQDYNTTIRTFPDIIGAKLIHGAEPMATFTAVTPNAEQAPDLGSVL